MKNMISEESFTFDELDASKRAMAEMVISERRTILKTLIGDLISHFQNIDGFIPNKKFLLFNGFRYPYTQKFIGTK